VLVAGRRWGRCGAIMGRLFLLAVDRRDVGYYYPGEGTSFHWLLYYEAEAVGYEVDDPGARSARTPVRQKSIDMLKHTALELRARLARWRRPAAPASAGRFELEAAFGGRWITCLQSG